MSISPIKACQIPGSPLRMNQKGHANQRNLAKLAISNHRMMEGSHPGLARESSTLPGDSFSMNFLVVLGFDLLFANIDVFVREVA